MTWFRDGTRYAFTRATAFWLIAGFGWLGCGFLWGQSPAPPAPVRTVQGVVKSGKIPLPGVTVTASNHATGQKVVGWTQPDGSYKLALPGDGDYVVRAQMTAFAVATSRATLSPSSQN